MFITFEGIDFCGKTTQVIKLNEWLVKRGKKVRILREPGGTEISEKIRTILLDKQNSNMYMETELLLFYSARAQLVREYIRPLLNDGIYVISDRFHDSSYAYQGFGRGINVEFIKKLSEFTIGETLPEVTFYIDISVEEADRRKLSQQLDLDRIEVTQSNFYNRVVEGYRKLASEEKRVTMIDGTMSIDAIHKIITDTITERESNYEKK